MFIKTLISLFVLVSTCQSFCLVSNKGLEPENVLVYTAFASWNRYLPGYAQLSYTGVCTHTTKSVPDGIDTIAFKDVEGSAGRTGTTVVKDKRNNIISTEFDIWIDVKELRSASLFYNVLLHELGHVVGLKHPHGYDPTSVMGYNLKVGQSGQYIIDDYIAVSINDIIALRVVHNHHPLVLYQSTVPAFPPNSVYLLYV